MAEDLGGAFTDINFSLPVDESNMITRHHKDKDKHGNAKIVHFLQTMESNRVKVEFFLKITISHVMRLNHKTFYHPVTVVNFHQKKEISPTLTPGQP